MTPNPDIIFITEYIKNELYFAVVSSGKTIQSTLQTHYFCIDNELVYENFYSDFGPLNLGCVYSYCKLLSGKLKRHKKIVHYTSTDSKKKTNAAFLIGCYGVLYLKMMPRDALKPLINRGQSFRLFQDATQGESIFTISLLDCFSAIKKARQLHLFNFKDFDYEEYQRLDRVKCGDLNWIVPGKFLAFIGPVDYSVSLYHPPQMYIDYFKENDIKIVIRLNKRMYDPEIFACAGITHYDLYFPDGSCPPRHILMKFLQIAEEAKGAIAVHCKAWLEQLEAWLIKQGNNYRQRMFQDANKLPVHTYGIYSKAQKLLKQRVPVLEKVPSPHPQPVVHPKKRPDYKTPISRPEASVFRKALNKTNESELQEWRMISHPFENAKIMERPFSPSTMRHCNTSDQAPDTELRRIVGAGEPRETSPTSHGLAAGSSRKANTLSHQSSDIPVPSFRPTGSFIKTLSDAKDFLRKTSVHQRERALISVMKVVPCEMSSAQTENVPNAFAYSHVPRAGNTSSVYRRRLALGRSPSPSPNTSPTRFVEQSRATNTPTQGITPKTNYKDRKLKKPVKTDNGGSIGGASVGAGSLGASRDAPADSTMSPSVRSDERSLATQGDMLNSIKFQRSLRDDLGRIYVHYDNNRSLDKKDEMSDTSRRTWRTAVPISPTSWTLSWPDDTSGNSRRPWRSSQAANPMYHTMAGSSSPPPFRASNSPPRPKSPKARTRNTIY